MTRPGKLRTHLGQAAAVARSTRLWALAFMSPATSGLVLELQLEFVSAKPRHRIVGNEHNSNSHRIHCQPDLVITCAQLD